MKEEPVDDQADSVSSCADPQAEEELYWREEHCGDVSRSVESFGGFFKRLSSDVFGGSCILSRGCLSMGYSDREYTSNR